MRTIAPPVGRGWEYLDRHGWDWDAELAELPDLLAEKLAAPSVEAGRYDLVIHPSNLWLTIHESIGHATELDRALGYEANYAGTSFATVDQLGTLQYGSPVMHVTGDRTVEHGLSTIGYDDEGVAHPAAGTSSGRRARRLPARPADGARCSRAQRRPLQRLRVRRLPRPHPDPADGQRLAAAGPRRPVTEDLIGRVERGIYVVGDKSWSIDMQRYNFQFTGQRFYRIEDGRLAGQLRDVAYQATTTDFWGSMEAVGGPDTWVLGGAFNCGKAQPGQVAAGQPRLPDRAVPRRTDPQHRRDGGDGDCMTAATVQELVEHALAASTADDCVVIAHDATSANLRWANNTLTTNGVMRGVDVTVVAFARRRRASPPARCRRAPPPPTRSTPWSPPPTPPPARRPGRGRRAAGRRRRGRGLGRRPRRDRHRRLRRLRAGAGRGVRPGRAGGRMLYGFVDHQSPRRTSAPRTGLRLRHVQPTGHYGCTARPPT